jgi:H+/gluconate symporter-like permease
MDHHRQTPDAARRIDERHRFRSETACLFPISNAAVRFPSLAVPLLVVATSPLFAGEPVDATTLVVQDVKPGTADAEIEKQREVTIGLMALVGILVGGLVFLAVVMIWGARLRRIARAELPPQRTLQNELWFLKPPKSPPDS